MLWFQLTNFHLLTLISISIPLISFPFRLSYNVSLLSQIYSHQLDEYVSDWFWLLRYNRFTSIIINKWPWLSKISFLLQKITMFRHPLGPLKVFKITRCPFCWTEKTFCYNREGRWSLPLSFYLSPYTIKQL